MTDAVNDVLNSFDRLNESDQARVVSGICQRIKKMEDASLIEEITHSADLIFQMLDKEEESHGKAETW